MAKRRHDWPTPSDVTPAKILSRTNPVYPPLLRAHRIDGEARVALVVMEDGVPAEVECLMSNDRRFADAAVEAVRKWRFKPAESGGKPVPISMEVPIIFTLDPSKPIPSSSLASTPRIASPSAMALTGDPERDYQQLQALQAARPPEEFARESDGFFSWLQERRRKVYDLGLEYISRYGTDARRWEVLLLLQYGRNHIVTGLPDGSRSLIPEPVERAAWERKYYPWLEELVASHDAGTGARADALRQLIDYAASNVERGAPDAETTIAQVLAWTDRFERENPNSGRMATLYRTVALTLSTLDAQRGIQYLNEKRAAHSKDSPADIELRKRLDRTLRFAVGQQRPVTELWQQLKALDPARIDESAYRGKVVLIASLAVDWSSRTVELEELYRKHHDAGLEIVQVAYYNANRAAPPEQRDKAAMRRYVTARQWPWQVVWDPRDSSDRGFWDYWDLNSVPAFFLIGRDGCIARPRTKKLGLDRMIADELARPVP